MFDFKCPDGHVFEKLVKSDIHEVTCVECSKLAQRQISTPTIGLDGTDPSFPTAWDKWDRVRNEKLAQERAEKNR